MTRIRIRFSTISVLIATGMMSAIACSGDAAGPTLRKDVMWDLVVFPKAASLAEGETLPLTIKPLDYNGEVIDTDVTITYRSSDDSSVSVDSAGVITAKRNTNGQGVAIYATVQAGLVTKQQSTMVGVTKTPVDVDSITIHPLSGDPVVAVGSSASLQPRAFDAQGNEVFNVYTRLEANEGPFYLFGSILSAQVPGKALVRATVFVNGKLLSDSIEYRTRWRDNANLTVSKNPNGGFTTLFVSRYAENVYISPNATVDFINNLSTPMDVIFEQPDDAKGSQAGAPGGDIIALQPGKRVSRWFPTVGDYFFTVQSGADSKRLSVTVKE